MSVKNVENLKRYYLKLSFLRRFYCHSCEGRNPLPMMYYVYIMASKKNGTLYIGVTDNLVKRVWEHKNEIVECFSKKYHIHKLVYFEESENINSAIIREKQLKKWNRAWKIRLIDEMNPNWEDLYLKIT